MGLIEAKAIDKLLYEELPMKYFYGRSLNTAVKNQAAIRERVAQIPAVDAVPVKHGQWVFGVDSETGERDLKAWTCSECNEKYPWQPNYCPNCGAKMDGERRESE